MMRRAVRAVALGAARERAVAGWAGVFVLLVGLAVDAGPATAGDPSSGSLELKAARQSQIRLDGSTTIHRWACEGEGLSARMEIRASLERVHGLLTAVESQVPSGPIDNGLDLPRIPPPTFHLVIPVDNLDCGNRAMERDLHDALKSDIHPTIEYRFQALRGARLEPDDGKHPRRYALEITGTLTLAGVSREIRSTAWAEAWAPDGFHLQGELHLKMTQFEVTPPTALFGLIRARDSLVVRYDLYLEAASVRDAPRHIERGGAMPLPAPR